ncbi:cohesin domain-containing protein [Patescibacteria group bacterium]|nr:cohesin domain-containing protein [Patescibacteria group bacterium]
MIIFFLAFSLGILALPQMASASTLSLDPANGTFNQGCTFPVNIMVDTTNAATGAQTQTDGTDAILLYVPSVLAGQSITNGTIYPDFPGNNIDNTAGKVTISGLASVSTPFAGKGVLATVNFTVASNAPPGATQVKFDFDPGAKDKTTDSNIVERGTVVDTLNAVFDGNYIIGTGPCGAGSIAASPSPGSTSTATSGSSATGTSTGTSGSSTGTFKPGTGGGSARGGVIISTPSSEFKTLPPAGSEKLTFTLAIVGSALTVLGILGIALL